MCNKAELTKKYERIWTLGCIIGALLKSGLCVEAFEEHPDAFWEEFPNLKEEDRTKFPNTFSLLMRK